MNTFYGKMLSNDLFGEIAGDRLWWRLAPCPSGSKKFVRDKNAFRNFIDSASKCGNDKNLTVNKRNSVSEIGTICVRYSIEI